ncbi:hypothetical protein, partial [Synechococcus sp. R55.5]|uniref:hypothetical protein n=1 Tax=Synechococcus sp. R55.5 TaxID=2964498 RepID=UPI0039C05DA7
FALQQCGQHPRKVFDVRVSGPEALKFLDLLGLREPYSPSSGHPSVQDSMSAARLRKPERSAPMGSGVVVVNLRKGCKVAVHAFSAFSWMFKAHCNRIPL